MSLDASANKVYLLGHAGPHPEEYHDEVFRRLSNAVRTCTTTSKCRVKLTKEIYGTADEVCSPGSKLHRLATNP